MILVTFATKIAFKMSQEFPTVQSTRHVFRFTEVSSGTYVMLTLSCVRRDITFRRTKSYVYELAAPSTSCVVEEEERAVFCVVCFFETCGVVLV